MNVMSLIYPHLTASLSPGTQTCPGCQFSGLSFTNFQLPSWGSDFQNSQSSVTTCTASSETTTGSRSRSQGLVINYAEPSLAAGTAVLGLGLVVLPLLSKLNQLKAEEMFQHSELQRFGRTESQGDPSVGVAFQMS